MRRRIRPSVRRRRERCRYAGFTAVDRDAVEPLGEAAAAAEERAGWLAEAELLLTETASVDETPPEVAEAEEPVVVVAKIGPEGVKRVDAKGRFAA